MAKRTKSSLGSSEGLTYRSVVGGPTSFFITEVLDHLRATAQPETWDLLLDNNFNALQTPTTLRESAIGKLNV